MLLSTLSPGDIGNRSAMMFDRKICAALHFTIRPSEEVRRYLKIWTVARGRGIDSHSEPISPCRSETALSVTSSGGRGTLIPMYGCISTMSYATVPDSDRHGLWIWASWPVEAMSLHDSSGVVWAGRDVPASRWLG